MASKDIEKYRNGAEIYQGHDVCERKITEMQAEFEIPTGLLRLDYITEFGFNRQTGFVWIRQKKKTEHRFKEIGNTVSYDTEITAFVAHRKMSKITGIKGKELLIWIALSDMYTDDPAPGKISFKSYAGLRKTYPASAFVLEGEKKEKEGKM